MVDPIAAWQEEHRYFNRLLAMLQHEVEVFATAETPNYVLMQEIIDYLTSYADQYHHPREDEAFRRLAMHRADRELPIARLRQEHRVIAHAGATLKQLLDDVVADAMVSREAVEVAAATFLVYYGNHIALEEEDILPLAARTLTADDWQAVRDAVPTVQDPRLAANPSMRFRELRRLIAMEAA